MPVVKEKFQIEFPVHASASLIFEYISTSTGLSEWFADKVIEHQEEFTFIWSGQEETAHLIRYKEDNFVRFRWNEDEDTKYFFEIAIVEDEITNDIEILITDFAEPDDIEESKLYWENKIDDLKKVIGC